MDNELLIHDFLDGTLRSDKEQMLFTSLSTSEEARAEFKKQLAIKTAVKNDVKAYTAPASAAVSIFSELGISSALGGAAGTIATKPGLFSKTWKAYSQAIITFIGTAAASVAVFLMLDFGGISDSIEIEQKEFKNTELNHKQNEKIKERDVPKVQQKTVTKYIFTNDPNKLNGVQKSKAITYLSQNKKLTDQLNNWKNKFTALNNDYKNLKEFEKLEKYSKFEKNKKSEFLKIAKSNSEFNNMQNLELSDGLQSPNSSFQAPDLVNNFSKGKSIGLPFNFEISGLSDLFLENTNDDLIANNFNGMRFELSVNTNQAWSFGADIRNENFYQKYNYMIDGQPFIFEQNPNFWVMSGFVKYNPDFLNNSFIGIENKPFFQLTAGAGNAGPVGRLMFGTQVEMFSGMYFKTGLEYSYLNYTQDALNYQSDKISLQFGIGFSNK